MNAPYATNAIYLKREALTYFAGDKFLFELVWTVDGLRVFSVVIAAPFTYLLMTFINSLSLWKALK